MENFIFCAFVAHYFVKYLTSTSERINNNISLLSFVFFRIPKLFYFAPGKINTYFTENISRVLLNSVPKTISLIFDVLTVGGKGLAAAGKSHYSPTLPVVKLARAHISFQNVLSF